MYLDGLIWAIPNFIYRRGKNIVLIFLLSICFNHHARTQAVLSPIDSLINITQVASNDSLINDAYRALMLHYIRNTKEDSALYWGQELLDFSKASSYPRAAITANYYMAFYHYRKGNYPEVIELSKKSGPTCH